MARISAGEQVALGILIDRYWERLVGYAAGIVADGDAAQDVVQSAFIQVWKRRAEWDTRGSVAGYLFRITRNLALNARRDARLRETRDEEWSDFSVRWRRPATPGDDLRREALRRDVEEAVSSLSERRREVFVLSRYHGLTHREIAETLGTSAQTVANQLSAALSELRSALSRHLGADAP